MVQSHPMRNAESQQTIKLQNELKNIYKEPLENFNFAPNSNQDYSQLSNQR